MRKLRHTATSREQEYRRDVEMREAVKAAEERALRAWRDSRPHFPFAKEVHQQPKAWEREHGSLWDLKTAPAPPRARHKIHPYLLRLWLRITGARASAQS